MVGVRQGELAAISLGLNRSRRVVVIGEPGSGRSALLVEAAKVEGGATYVGGGLATLTWSSLLALRRALRLPLPQGDPATIAAFVTRRVGNGLLVVDDLQWTDPETQDVLERLPRSLRLLTAVRSGEVGAPDAGALAGRIGCEPVDLLPLTDGDAGKLVRNARPDLGLTDVAAIVEGGAGNPFWLLELARSGGQGDRRAVASRLVTLPEEARTVLCALGLLGRPMSAEVLGTSVDWLVNLGLATITPEGVSARPPLLAELAAGMLEDDARKALHARLATMVSDPGERAHHLAAAGLDDLAYAAACEAADAARHAGERARHLALAAVVAPPTEGPELRLRAAEALLAIGDAGAAQRLLARGEDGRSELAGRWALASARAAVISGDAGRASELLAGALLGGADLDPAVAVQLRIEHAAVLALHDPALAATRAATLAAEAETDAIRCRALTVQATAEIMSGSPRADATIAEAISAARALDDIDSECLVETARLGAALARLDCGFGRTEAMAAAARCRSDLADGWATRFEVAAMWFGALGRGPSPTLPAELAHRLTTVSDPFAREQLRGLAALVEIDAGDPEVGRQLADAALVMVSPAGTPLAGWISVEAALACGRVRDVVTLVGQTTGWPAPFDELAQVAVGWSTGAPETRESWTLPGTESEANGAALRMDSAGQAATSLMAACAAWKDRLHRNRARCGVTAAELLASVGRDGESTQLLSALTSGDDARVPVWLEGRLRRLHRAMGIADGAQPPALDPQSAGLTRRETQVMRLVQHGLTSSVIADRLGMTRLTVDSHVRSARQKLGADTRAQAAAKLGAGDR